MKVAVVERRDVPIVAVQIVIAAGAALDLPAHAGRISMTAEMLDEGTPTRAALDIAEEIDYLGADLSIQPGWDATTISLDVMSNRLERALDVLADIMLNATFPDEEYERKRKERLSHLLFERDEPRALAGKALAAGIFGSAHPYGAPVAGTRASIEGLTRATVHDLYCERFHAGQAFTVVVGDVSAVEIGALLEARLGAWRATTPITSGLPDPPTVAATRVLMVDKPGAAQAELRVGHPAPERTTPDYFSLKVLNTVLGGSFTSRLNTILRERMGVTYGARSRFRLKQGGGVFNVAAAIETDAIARSAQVVIEEMTRLRETRVAGEELSRAQHYVALGLPRYFETASDIAVHLREQMLYALPADYWETYVDRILAVTADDVMRAAARHLQPANAVIAIVADRKRVQAELDAAGLGEVIVTEVPT